MMSIGNCTKDTSSGYFGFVQSNREQKHKTGVIPVKDRDSQLSMLYRNNISYGIILYGGKLYWLKYIDDVRY